MAEAPTQLLLRRMAEGHPEAAEELLPLLYGELHDLASGYMGGERREHTLQPTALVHEAWLRLLSDEPQPWKNRAHFLGVAARAMRRVLIDHARRRDAAKRGGGWQREPLDAALDLFERSAGDLVALDAALARLARFDPELARIVELRFFAGAANGAIAEALGVSTRTVERGWKTAQAWLRAELGEGGAVPGAGRPPGNRESDEREPGEREPGGRERGRREPG